MYLLSHLLECILLFTLIVTWVKCLPSKDKEFNSSSSSNNFSLLSLFADTPSNSSDWMGSTFNYGSNSSSGIIKVLNPSSNLPDNRTVNGFSGFLGPETNTTDQRGSSNDAINKTTFVERVKTGASRIGEKVGTFFQNIPKVASGICLQRCACGCEHNRCKDCGNQTGNATYKPDSINN